MIDPIQVIAVIDQIERYRTLIQVPAEFSLQKLIRANIRELRRQGRELFDEVVL